MTDRMQKNVERYAIWAVISIAIAVLTALATQLNGTEDIVWRPIVAAGISATLGVLTMAVRSMYLTRVGSEDLGVQVDMLRDEGVHRRDMVVLRKPEVAEGTSRPAAAIPSVHPEMTPDQTDLLLNLIQEIGPTRTIAVLDDALYREDHAP